MGKRSEELPISRVPENGSPCWECSYGKDGTRPDAKRRVLRKEPVKGDQEDGFGTARRSGQGGADALAAEPTVAGASGAAGEVFGSADRPTKEHLKIFNALQPSRWANPQLLK